MGSIPQTGAAGYPSGVHVPSLTWFLDDSNQDIDWELQEKHIEFLVSSGLDGGM